MKFSTTITEKVTKQFDVDLEPPAFFKSKFGSMLAIYSEERTIKISSKNMGDDFCIISRCAFSILSSPEDYLNGEKMTEAEFNAALSEAIQKISGVEVSKEVPEAA